MREKGWKELPIGAKILQAGNSIEYETGSWRTFRPFVDKTKCINCMRCWLFCPDASVYAEDEEMQGFDYVHCKGCGICAEDCPVDAIEMVLESEKGKINADERGIKVVEEEEKKETE
jgi:pyruvate ferredoxin oxidoreductase delta subunit